MTLSSLKVGCFLGSCFTTKKGLPCVSLGYWTDAEAKASRDHVAAALNGVEEVLGR